MITMDDRQLKRYEKELKAFATKAYPFATRETVNVAAFTAQKHARSNVEKSFVNRNKFTIQSIQVEPERTSLDVRRQQAVVGSTQDYMEDQEFGDTRTAKGKYGVRIPTSYSAGLPEDAIPRSKAVRTRHRMNRIKLRRGRVEVRNEKQRHVKAVKRAAESGQKYIFLDLGKRQGLYHVGGSKTRPRLKMVHDLTKRTVRIPRRPWLGPATSTTIREIPSIYQKSLINQLKRHGIFDDL